MGVTTQTAISFSILIVAIAGSVSAAPVLSEKAACSLVRQRVSQARHVESIAAEFCDIIPAASAPAGMYVIGLHHTRSKKDCPDICSTLMGWFAVRKQTGEVSEFDIAEQRVTPLRIAPR